MTLYVTILATSILAGLAAMILARPAHPADRKAFTAGALLNLGALLAFWHSRKRRNQ
jgi:hypothetical protein